MDENQTPTGPLDMGPSDLQQWLAQAAGHPIPMVRVEPDPDPPYVEEVRSEPVDTREFERRQIIRWMQPGPFCFPVVIVARMNPHIGDWAAYIGGVTDGADIDEAGELVGRWGAKLPEDWATAMFPIIAAEYRYRE